MNRSVEMILYFIASIGWVMGIVLAKGGWSTIFAICCPCYSWYLLIERIMIENGILC